MRNETFRRVVTKFVTSELTVEAAVWTARRLSIVCHARLWCLLFSSSYTLQRRFSLFSIDPAMLQGHVERVTLHYIITIIPFQVLHILSHYYRSVRRFLQQFFLYSTSFAGLHPVNRVSIWFVLTSFVFNHCSLVPFDRDNNCAIFWMTSFLELLTDGG